mmetsp:Transcript_21077/g.3414  ORF Transcript_21077/g.3414 Transcript_21077/m.3414 type:complete len:83 (+) Transcript_21077:31-279(+)
MSATLQYFPAYGRGEAIRLVFQISGAEYQDEFVSFEDWPGIKETLEFQRMPCLRIDGHSLVETQSILRYVGAKFGFVPTDLY